MSGGAWRRTSVTGALAVLLLLAGCADTKNTTGTPSSSGGMATFIVRDSADSQNESKVQLPPSADPSQGLDGYSFIQLTGEVETKTTAKGEHLLCVIAAIGSPHCTFKEGQWHHLLIRASGERIILNGKTLEAYRVRAGDQDAWFWHGKNTEDYEDGTEGSP